MEKLIMLIDIYEEEVVGIHSVGDKITDKEVARIISKQFGFIKRLVDNDKIDYEKSPGEIMFDDLMGTQFSLEDSIVMTLSISENPIDDLISYLK